MDRKRTYSEANKLLPAQHLRYNLGLYFGSTEVKDRRKSDDTTTQEAVTVSPGTASDDFLTDDQLMEVVKLSSLDEQL